MAEFAKRPEITVSTMVRHSSRSFVLARSSTMTRRSAHLFRTKTRTIVTFFLLHALICALCVCFFSQGRVHNPTGEGVRAISSEAQAKAAKVVAKTSEPKAVEDEHETKVVEGTAKRNITRKKTADKDTGNFNSAFKKQGGHGKGQWKEMMDPSYAEKDPIDEKDPIYDEAEDSSRYILSSIEAGDAAEKRGYDPGTSKAVYGPLLTLSEFKLQLTECIHEYYDSADTDEVIRTLEELGCQEYHSEIVKRAVSLALDKSSRSRELTSRLLTCLHPTPMTMSDMTTGFEKLLDSMEDLQTDVPDAAVSPKQTRFRDPCARVKQLYSVVPFSLLVFRRLWHPFWHVL